MNFYYFDTNALVKLLLIEKGHDETIKIYNQDETMIVISNLSITEIYSALNGKKNRNEITEVMYNKAISGVNNLILKSPKICTIEIKSEHYKVASEMVIKHKSLRSLDALHLATALEYRDIPIIFVSADKKLTRAVNEEGIQTMNFETCTCPKCGSKMQQKKVVSSVCKACGNTSVQHLIQCINGGCGYVCTECHIDFCKKYIDNAV